MHFISFILFICGRGLEQCLLQPRLVPNSLYNPRWPQTYGNITVSASAFQTSEIIDVNYKLSFEGFKVYFMDHNVIYPYMRWTWGFEESEVASCILNTWCLGHFSIAAQRHHVQCNYYKRKHFLETLLIVSVV